MFIYGQAITEVHHRYWELLKVSGSNETLNLASYFCLEIGRGHVPWDGVVVLYQGVDCFINKLSLFCLWKRRDDMAHHSTSAPVFGEFACGIVSDIVWEDYIAGDGGGVGIAYA